MSHDDGPDELWRLGKGRDVLVCCMSRAGERVVALSVLRNGSSFIAEEHAGLLAAFQRADTLRRQFLDEGWTGAFDR